MTLVIVRSSADHASLTKQMITECFSMFSTSQVIALHSPTRVSGMSRSIGSRLLWYSLKANFSNEASARFFVSAASCGDPIAIARATRGAQERQRGGLSQDT